MLRSVLKNIYSTVTGISVLILATIPLLVAADHLNWLRWKYAVIIVASIALISIVVQGIIQFREDRGREAREHERDEKFRELATMVMRYSPSLSAFPGISAEATVTRGPVWRGNEIAYGLYELLTEKIPDKQRVILYESDFLDRVRGIVGELKALGMVDDKFSTLASQPVSGNDDIRAIADGLLSVFQANR